MRVAIASRERDKALAEIKCKMVAWMRALRACGILDKGALRKALAKDTEFQELCMEQVVYERVCDFHIVAGQTRGLSRCNRYYR